MFAIATRYYVTVRHALGMATPMDRKDAPPREAVPANELAALLDSRRPHPAVIGGGGLLVILALMVLKPF